jgi:NAD(P)-dependent dehydrogenase (short-subunit alcohol dehydrogenase family)
MLDRPWPVGDLGVGIAMTSPVAVITGASRGIGAATADRFLRGGWAVINVARHPAPTSGVVNLGVDLARLDVGTALAQSLGDAILSLSPAASSVEAPHKRRICLVHNAAAFESDSSLDMDASHLRRVLEVNIVAPLLLNTIVAPRMAVGSSIIYVGSTLSEKAVAGRASYVVSKHALVGLMRATCQDALDGRLHTVCICPGFVDTEMIGDASSQENARSQLEGRTAFGRLIRPDEIAELAWTAALTPTLNGAVLHANLGQIER